MVIKVGGAAGIDPAPVARDLAEIIKSGQKVVLVHGGSDETNRVAELLGHPAKFLSHENGMTSRVTDRETLAIFEMIYCGKVNKAWVELLQQNGVNAIGLSGLDGGLLRGERKKAVKYLEAGKLKIHRGDFTGKVQEVNLPLINNLLDFGLTPVLTPPALSWENEAINVDGDTIATLIATALQAQTLIFLSNVPGLLADFPDPNSLVREVKTGDLEANLAKAQGRMKTKLKAAAEAVHQGVGKVIIASALGTNPILKALAGEGTQVANEFLPSA